MQRKQLQDTLVELRETLGGMDRIDESTRQSLHVLVDDLQGLLQQEDGPSRDDIHPVKRDLKDLLLRFETEHPQLTSILGRIADGLANLGI